MTEPRQALLCASEPSRRAEPSLPDEGTNPTRRRLLAARLAAFRDDVSGTLTVETALMMPMLAFFYVASFVWFDAFRAQNDTLKATYTIADMVSRETTPLETGYLPALANVFDWLTYSQAPTQVRISTARCTADCDDDDQRALELCWSWSTPDISPLNDSTFDDITGRIPLMALGDTVIIAETMMLYQPPFSVRIDKTVLENLVVTRPRYAPQVNLGALACYADPD